MKSNSPCWKYLMLGRQFPKIRPVEGAGARSERNTKVVHGPYSLVAGFAPFLILMMASRGFCLPSSSPCADGLS